MKFQHYHYHVYLQDENGRERDVRIVDESRIFDIERIQRFHHWLRKKPIGSAFGSVLYVWLVTDTCAIMVLPTPNVPLLSKVIGGDEPT